MNCLQYVSCEKISNYHEVCLKINGKKATKMP